MTNIAQVWAIPALDLPAEINLESGVSLKSVALQAPNGQKGNALLLQTQTTSEDLNANPEGDFRRIGQVLSRLSFSMMCPFSAFSARVIRSGLNEGEPVEEIVFPGSPPGIALFEGKVGYAKTRRFDPAFLQGKMSADIESAISWFLMGAYAANSVQQVICHWIGLESLAPTISGPWRCPACGNDVPSCPHCDAATSGPKTVLSIRDYIETSLGVARKEYKALYDLRCRISHGGLAMDPEGMQKASDKAFRIQELLLLAIKKSLGWDETQPPLIQAQGMTIVGTMALHMQGTVAGSDFYDSPGVFPA